MDAPERPSLLDRAVGLVARLLDALGLNGSRLHWRWSHRRRDKSESTERLLRSTQGRHKMCPSCRALVPKRAGTCSECGERIAGVSAPGWGRALANLFPGMARATSLLFLVNGALFLMMLATPPVSGAGGGPRMGFDIHTLMRFGGGRGLQVLVDGEWWRIVTSIFVHGGLLHMAMNSLALVRLGPLVEDLFGPERFWSVYLWSGLSGSLAAQLLRPGTFVVGASGAICGLVGLLLAYGYRRGGLVGRNIRNSMIETTLYILAFSLIPGVSLLSHAGGFAGGFVAGLVVAPGPSRDRRVTIAWQVVALGGATLVLWAFYNVSVHGQDFVKYL